MLFETATNTYTTEKEIGQGGAGTVFRVLDGEGHPYALKRLNATSSLKRRRFKNELSFCQQEQHPNIIRVVDSGVVLGTKEPLPFYVMPVYDCTLRTLISEGIQHDGVLPLFDQVLSGTEAAHLKGVFHRDLKPENILYDRGADCLVVADFGVAHFEEDDLLTAVETKDQERLANFTYAAPEQRVRGQAVDHRADIFALGLILNEMFTKTAPLATGHPLVAAVAPNQAYVDELIERMILHSPGDRPQSLRSVKEELFRRGNEFVALQRLDAARRAVVPAFSPEDPLLGQDVEITGDFDYDSQAGLLKIGLKPTPPETWWRALGEVGEFPYMASAHPKNVGFANGKALIPARVASVEQVFGMFRQWIASANKMYREKLFNEARQREKQAREQLAQQQRAAEERVQVLERLRRMP
jgi:tRNA A-37 threonylcarbamoyl transferase component Bud32